MKTLDPGFARHLASGATSLCTCWRLTRTDGAVLGFTDHDVALSFEGTVYAPAAGADGSERPAKLGAATDTADILGLISSPDLTDGDLRLGRYEGADVMTYRVNWRDPSVRDLLRRDTIGEITREDGYFRAELRAGQSVLNRKMGRLYQSVCGTALGSAQCGIDLDSTAYTASATMMKIRDRNRLEIAGLSAFAAGWFAFGTLQWQSGTRAGLADTVTAHQRENGVDIFTLARDAQGAAPGDGLVVRAGCDRRFATCRQKFANQVNFRGFPHIPGADYVLSYPKDGTELAGKALVK